MTPAFPRCALLLISILLAGCAGEATFREGRALLAEGQAEAGLAKLQQAMSEAPNNLEIRNAYYRERDLQIAQLLGQADLFRQRGDLDAAALTYARVQAIDRNNERARTGGEAIALERRHRERIKEAESLLAKGRADAAEAAVARVLMENPAQKEARVLKRRLAEKAAAVSMVSPSLRNAFTKPVSTELREAPIRSVFDFLTRVTGINFVLDKEVRSDLKASLVVKNTAVEDVIRLLLVTNQLEQKVLNDNTILIYPNTQNKTKEYQDLVVKGFYLANADVKQVANTIKTLVKTKDIVIDEKLKYLAIRDTPEAVRLAEKLIANQDIADPEVMLELEVLEVSVNRLLDLGIRYPEQVSFGVIGADKIPGTLTLSELHSHSSGMVRMSITNPALILNLKKEDSDTNLLANPRIRVKNHEKAKVHVGERVPVITTTSTANVGVSEAVSYLDVGLKLEVEPNVTLDDEVSMKVGLEVSNILETVVRASGLQTYRLGTRNTTTTLQLKDNETQVLAGLIQDDERRSANKVPGLGDIPLLGHLFSSRSDNSTKTEIVLLITPRIMRNITRPDADSSEFFSGTDAVISTAPIRLREANAGDKPTAAAAPAGVAEAKPTAPPAANATIPAIEGAPEQGTPAPTPAVTEPPVPVQAAPQSQGATRPLPSAFAAPPAAKPVANSKPTQ